MSYDNGTTKALTKQVQYNCHLSDAIHAREYSLCIYLLKMREYFRWEQGYAFGESLPKGPLGEWITAREQLWEHIEESDYQRIDTADDTSHSPYESDDINRVITAGNLIYSGGYYGPKPHFFLAELEQTERSGEVEIYISGKELARELTAPPAMSLGNRVFLRRESLTRMIWEKLEEWGWQDPNRAIARAANFYPFKKDLLGSLDAMASNELNTLLEHELGEVEVGLELGPEWESMLATLPRSRAEFWLRAVRDHLVDCRRTLPRLLSEERDAALHFYFANFTTMRKNIFPELQQAYEKWVSGDRGQRLAEEIKRGAEHWQQSAHSALEIFRQCGDDDKALLKQLNQLSQT